jgi:hypothetical protein
VLDCQPGRSFSVRVTDSAGLDADGDRWAAESESSL